MFIIDSQVKAYSLLLFCFCVSYSLKYFCHIFAAIGANHFNFFSNKQAV